MACLLAMFLTTQASAWAGILIDDFNTNRPYAPCCGEYGTYWAFDSNVFQFGTNGSVLIGGTATDNGGFYRDQGGTTLWNFTAQSNLTVTARILEGNQAANFIVLFRDAKRNNLLFSFPFSLLNATNFTTLVKPLSAPDWTDATSANPFDFSRVISWDVYGGFTEEDLPIRFEIDSVELEGPTVTGNLQMRYEVADGVLILAWPTNMAGGFLLQSAGTLPGYWTNEWAIIIVSNEYRFSQPLTNVSQFYRLLATAENQGQYSLMDEEDWLTAIETAKPVFARVEVSQTDLPAIPPFPPMPPGLSLNWFGMQSMNGEAAFDPIPIPDTNPPISASSFVDINLFASFSSNQVFADFSPWGGVVDYDSCYTLKYSQHRGGYDSFEGNSYESHSLNTNAPTGWDRDSSNIYSFSWNTVWDSPTNNGLKTETGCYGEDACASPPYYVSPPNSGAPFYIYGATIPGMYQDYPYPGNAGYLHVYTQLDLHAGLGFSNSPFTFVRLSASASSLNSIGPYVDFPFFPIGSGLLEFWDWSPLFFSNIFIMGKPLNADSQAFFQVRAGSVSNATPTFTGATNYLFNVTVMDHKKVSLSRVYHQFFHISSNTVPALSNLQAAFNGGSLLLGQDDDDRIPDNDPSVAFSTNSSSLYRNDDVPAYVEFYIYDGPTNLCLVTRTGLPVLPRDFGTNRASAYFNVRTVDDAIELLNWSGANIKQVRTFNIPGVSGPGLGSTTSASIVLAEAGVNNETCVHEWGHNCGLWHRGELDTNGVDRNPGGVLGAIMGWHNVNFPRKEINRFERDTINNYLNNY